MQTVSLRTQSNKLCYHENHFQLLLNTQAQSLNHFCIRRRVAILLIDRTKAARVIPHGPANAVLFQRDTHVSNPGGAIRGWRKVLVGAELIASERDAILCSPGSRLSNFPVNAVGVPTIFAIGKQITTRRLILNSVENRGYSFGIRWVWDVLIKGHRGAGPGCTLMGERERLVKVEVVNNILIAIRN